LRIDKVESVVREGHFLGRRVRSDMNGYDKRMILTQKSAQTNSTLSEIPSFSACRFAR